MSTQNEISEPVSRRESSSRADSCTSRGESGPQDGQLHERRGDPGKLGGVASQVQTALKDLVKTAEGREPDALLNREDVEYAKDQEDRFLLWASSVGAVLPRRPSLSLDRRVRNNSMLQGHLLSILRRIEDSCYSGMMSVYTWAGASFFPGKAVTCTVTDRCRVYTLILAIDILNGTRTNRISNGPISYSAEDLVEYKIPSSDSDSSASSLQVLPSDPETDEMTESNSEIKKLIGEIKTCISSLFKAMDLIQSAARRRVAVLQTA